jgi:hypothetical protein
MSILYCVKALPTTAGAAETGADVLNAAAALVYMLLPPSRVLLVPISCCYCPSSLVVTHSPTAPFTLYGQSPTLLARLHLQLLGEVEGGVM